MGFFPFRNTSFCSFLSFHPEDLNLICGLLKRKKLFYVHSPSNIYLSVKSYQPLSHEIYYLRGKTFLVLYEKYSIILVSLLRMDFFLILLYLLFDKVAENACNVEDLHGFIYQFNGTFSFFSTFFLTFCSFYLFLKWFCLLF